MFNNILIFIEGILYKIKVSKFYIVFNKYLAKFNSFYISHVIYNYISNVLYNLIKVLL